MAQPAPDTDKRVTCARYAWVDRARQKGASGRGSLPHGPSSEFCLFFCLAFFPLLPLAFVIATYSQNARRPVIEKGRGRCPPQHPKLRWPDCNAPAVY
jgi:hypothetical protein